VGGTDRRLRGAPAGAPGAGDRAMADHVASLIEDGDTLQLGVGSLPNAVLESLAGHTDLGFHTGMITDGVTALVEKGVVTGARKEIDQGLVVTGAALGSTSLYNRLRDFP